MDKKNRKLALTGIKPTGTIHLGNYLGAIKPGIEMSLSGDFDCYYFIADYHSLITVHDPKVLKDSCFNVAASWLAMGLDPQKATLYRQSDIPEILELSWILSCFTAKGLMNRAHAYKAMVQENLEHSRDSDASVNMGLYSYPVLMAADILFLNSDVVPVGADQLQHIEICRDIAMAFNYRYGEVLKLPDAHIREDQALVPGLDGRKMSKSYDNIIPLFLTEKKLKKTINKIVTDSTPPEEPKDPTNSLVFDIYKLFATPDEINELSLRYQKGIGWGEAKASLFEVVNRELSEGRERYQELLAKPQLVEDILDQGAKRVRPRASEFLNRLKGVIGL